MVKKTSFSWSIITSGLAGAVIKLNPALIIKNPVMFVTWIGAVLTTLTIIFSSLFVQFSTFEFHIALWLWLTILFANFAESIAEGRSKAQADSLRKGRKELMARKLEADVEKQVHATSLKKGDVVVCEPNDIIPADGEIIEGIASVDESAITGESAPVIRESGGDRSAVTGGTRVLSDRIVVKVTAEAGNTFIDHIISLIEAATRQKTPNEIALTVVLVAFSLIMLLVVCSLKAFSDYSVSQSKAQVLVTVPVLTALFVCLIPTTIGGLLGAIGIAGMDRLIKKNVVAKSGRAIEAAGDIDVLLIDKTGTITLGNRMAEQFIPAQGVAAKDLAEYAQLASLADETPEGRSIVILAKEQFNLRARALHPKEAQFIPFSADTRVSGIDILDGAGAVITRIRKGAVDAISSLAKQCGALLDSTLSAYIEKICREGGTPLLVLKDNTILGVVHLKDKVKGGMREQFSELRKIGIKSIMITGDNPMTAAAIAAEAGVDDFIAEATPEKKLQCIREEQKQGRLVAMTGDGTNDAPALAQADVGVAMNTGTQAAREAGNMVDLDSSPSKVIEIVITGKQLLMTRGSLTTFSIANDVAKYFAIIPALFMSLYAENDAPGPLLALNIMGLATSKSALLSAIIFNALIIVLLIPLALRGVNYQAQSATNALRKNLLVYGIGGLITPFIGIKVIDSIISFFGVLS